MADAKRQPPKPETLRPSIVDAGWQSENDEPTVIRSMPIESITEVDELLDEESDDPADHHAAASALEPPPRFFRPKTPPPPAPARSTGRMDMSSEDELFEAVLGDEAAKARPERPVDASMNLFASQALKTSSRSPVPPLNPVAQQRSAIPLPPLSQLSPFGPASGYAVEAPRSPPPASPEQSVPQTPFGSPEPAPASQGALISPAPAVPHTRAAQTPISHFARRKGLGFKGALLLVVVSGAGGATAAMTVHAWAPPVLARIPAPLRRFLPIARLSSFGSSTNTKVAKARRLESAAPKTTPAAPATLLERAARGEDGSLRELEARPPGKLAVDEAVALLRGHGERETKRVAELRRRAETEPGAAQDATLIDQLRTASSDPRTAPDAVAAFAALPGPVGPDLLYEVWTGAPKRSEFMQVMDNLMFNDSLQRKASPALIVTLDLRRTEQCDAARDLLPRVIEHGDRRSLQLLGRFVRRSGCGETKREDCWSCLRGDTLLMEAIKAANQRPEPRYGSEAVVRTQVRAAARNTRTAAKKAPTKKAR